MKKILFALLLCTSYFVPRTAFSQSATYFHDRIDTTIYATTTGTNTYTGTNADPNFNVARYNRGLLVMTFFVNGNTGASTYRLVTRTGTLSSVAIRKQGGSALSAGDIPDSSAVFLMYYGSFWRLVGVHASSGSWSLLGNAGTTAGTNFIGTTDAVDFVIKTNNTEKARVSSAGVLSLGLASTNNGSLLFRNSTNANTLTINSGVTSASHAWTLPLAQGAAGTFLTNNGSGTLSWGGLTVGTTPISSGTSGAIPFNSGGVYGEDASLLFWDNAQNYLGVGSATPGFRLTVEESSDAFVNLASFRNLNGGTSAMGAIGVSNGTTAIKLINGGVAFSSATLGGAGSAGLLMDANASAGHMNFINANTGMRFDFYAGDYISGFGGKTSMSIGAGAGVNGVGINIAPASVSAKLHVMGATADNTAFWLKGDNSSSAQMLYGRNDGALLLGENVSVYLDESLSADGKYTGTTISGTAGATLAFGDVVYLAAADSRWELADADAASTAGDVLVGMCVLAAAADGSATTILLNGTIRADAAFPSFTISAPIFISTTAGDVTQTAPAGSADVVRRMGFAITADQMYFNPSNDYVTIP